MRFLTEDIIEAGNLTIEKNKEQKLQLQKVFSEEANALNLLNPYLLKFMVRVLLENKVEWVNQSKTILPALFNLCVQYFIKFWDKSKTKVAERMLHSCIQIASYCSEFVELFAASTVLEQVVNNELITRVAKSIDYDNQNNDKSFTEVKRLILETYLSLINLYANASSKGLASFDKILQTTKGISDAKRGYQIVKEKQEMKFLRYLHHHDQLKDHEKKLIQKTFET